ncbi:Uncharacterised protein [Vibrio cholerae]|nr:Uncharacterised protein [Vibrio cholerae]CSI45174.1 Uncharacterised protein [Vibrio cholerae]
MANKTLNTLIFKSLNSLWGSACRIHNMALLLKPLCQWQT